VSEDVAYVAYNQFVYAIRISDGSMIWKYPEKGSAAISFYAAPTLTEDGQLLVGGYDNILYSLDAESGLLNWSFAEPKDRIIGSPLATEVGIFLPSADGNLYALDYEGQLLWKFTAGGPLWSTPVTDQDCECIYLASMDHNLYSLDASNGDLRWKTNLGSAMVGSPALSEDGILYVGNFGKEMVAVNAENGDIVWRTPLDGWAWAGPTLVGDRLYFGDLVGNVYAANRADGDIIWKVTPDGPITAPPVFQNDSVYVTTDTGTLFALDPANGSNRWMQAVGGKLHGPAIVVEDEVILVGPISKDEILVALNTSGSPRWSFIPPK